MIQFDKPSEIEIGVEFAAAWASVEFAWRQGKELIEATSAFTSQDLFTLEDAGVVHSIFANRFGSHFVEVENIARSFILALVAALREAATATKRCLTGAFLGEASRIKQMEFVTGDEFIDVIEAAHSCWPDQLDHWPESVPRPDVSEVREFLNQIVALDSVPTGWPVLVPWVHRIEVISDKHETKPEIATFHPESVAGMQKKKRSNRPERHTRDRIGTLKSDGVARFDLQELNISFNITFNATPWPDDEQDCIKSRVYDLVQICMRIIRDLRTIATNPIGGHWLPFEHHNWKSIATNSEAREALRRSESGTIQCMIDDQHWILMESDGEVLGRMIPAPIPLGYSDDKDRGTAAEVAVRHSARWGLVDFVYRPHDYHKGGQATREINDSALISGKYGLAVQVKSKRPESESEREADRTAGLIAQAASQAVGSVRELRERARELTNDRGRKIHVDGNEITWIGVVVVDHSNPPVMDSFDQEVRGLPIVALFREEWEFLFEQLCSTTTVIHYLHAISSAGVLPGSHVNYYYRQAGRALVREQRTSPTRVITELDPVWLPIQPAATIDMRGARMFRQILEDIACGEFSIGADQDRLVILNLLDGLPAEERSHTGRLLITLLEESWSNGGSFHCRRYLFPNSSFQLCFVVSRASNAHEMFAIRTKLWHHELLEEYTRPNIRDPYTVALLLTPRAHEYRSWATLMMGVIGAMRYSDDEITELYREWNGGLSS
ncbi:hypothetical protein [Mycobacteroides immunogenum]|uniref:hypothetical protein n=1 Tax=Mycobacteroides immunogenum TaxID=83262 RepID=UPI000993A1AE|nr:hypothetical protein [Mycobacteroides immunogenum]MCV7308727.1 hypothetical protein [Mycobacteroides immunogenum]